MGKVKVGAGVHCPLCAKLLARIAEDGAAIVVHGGVMIVLLYEGHLRCPRCGEARYYSQQAEAEGASLQAGEVEVSFSPRAP